MTDEDYYDICRVLSLCYRGVEVLSDLDLERILSFDMGWLTPEDAETAVSALIDKGWLVGNRDELTLSGEIEENSDKNGIISLKLFERGKFALHFQKKIISAVQDNLQIEFILHICIFHTGSPNAT